MKKLKGPDIRMPKVKTPTVLIDLWRELRERRLLPLIALLVVAIVAIPFLLGKSESEPTVANVPGEALAAKSSRLTATPEYAGLRDYHRRFKGKKPSDPFEVPDSGDATTPTEGESVEGSSEAPVETSSSTATQESASSEAGSTGDANSTQAPANGSTTSGELVPGSEFTYYTHSIDTRTVNGRSGPSPKRSKPQVRRNIPSLSRLPSKKAPAAIFLGTDLEGRVALLMPSPQVQLKGGGGKCVLGNDEECRLLSLRPGAAEELAFPDGRVTRIKLLGVNLVVAPEPRQH
jgi:hypothetical protein